MKKIITLTIAGLMLAARGENATERGLSGGATGAVVGGPVGAIAGATLGATGAVKVK